MQLYSVSSTARALSLGEHRESKFRVERRILGIVKQKLKSRKPHIFLDKRMFASDGGRAL